MISAAAHRPAVVWACCAALLVAGAIAFTRLPLATRTTVELPRLQISASWPGAAPEVIETYLTSPLEAAAQGVRGVKRVSSMSIDGFASLTLDLEPGADVQMTRLAILERLELLRRDMPPGAYAPTVSNYVPEGLEEAPLMSVTINGPYTAGTLQKLLEERVNPRLSAVPGVAGVSVRGRTSMGVAVTYDAALLRRIGVSPQLVSSAVSGARIVQSLGVQTRASARPVAGAAPGGAESRKVILRDQPESLDDLLALPVRGAGGRVFALGDLVTVRGEEDSRDSFFRVGGAPAVALDVTRHPGADAIKTAAALRETILDLARSMPPGARLEINRDESEDLARELADLSKRGAIAFVAVFVVLIISLRRWRAVALVMGSTAVAVAATALTLYLFEIPANLLTLAGLGMGVGILVQNSLVVVQRLGKAADVAQARADAARRITPAIIGSTLTTAVVLFPFLYLQGNARAAFVPFAAAFVIALGWSVVTALLVVPALGKGVSMTAKRGPGRPWAAAILPPKLPPSVQPKQRSRTLRGREFLTRVYIRVLARILRWRAATLVTTVAVLAVMTWGFVKKVPRSSFGSYGTQRTTLTVSLSFPRGSDPVTLDRGMREFESIVIGRPEVEQVRTQGSTTRASMNVLFTRDGGYTAAPLEMQELLTQRAVLIGGASVGVYGQGPGFSSGGGGGNFSSFRIRVLGYSYDGVARIADDLKARLERITRVRDVRITSGGYFSSERGYEVTLEPDRQALAQHRLNATLLVQAIGREIRGPIGGLLLQIGGDELPVTVKASGARDRALDELESAIVPNASGSPVRIGDLATVSAREALSSVNREDQQYVRQVSYDFRGPTKLARRTHGAFMKQLSAPAGYTIADLSDSFGFDEDKSGQGLYLVFALGLALVVLAVALVFDSVWGAAMVFLSLPLSLAGVSAAFWATGAAFTREAAVGVILVVGLAVNHAILLVDAALAHRRSRQERGLDYRLDAGLVMRSALDRAAMILFITLASLASLAPLSIGTDAGSLFGAIALATAGGTVAALFGALFVLPAMLVGRRSTKPTRPPRKFRVASVVGRVFGRRFSPASLRARTRP